MKYRAIGENHLYGKAYAKGKKCVAARVVVYVLRDYRAEALRRADPLKRPINRIGLTVTKKLGGAVVRSRVKRILRAGFRAVDTENSIAKGNLIVIVARSGAVSAKSTDIARDLKYAFRKLGMLSPLSRGGSESECKTAE